MSSIDNLFENNQKWAKDINENSPQFFTSLEKLQAPKYLWIGCSDSRVPANEIVGLKPGEIFVHRNIGNVVVYSDLNCLSVIQFAVDVLGVTDILVVGHYNCGAVIAAETKSRYGLVDNWIHHIQDVRNRNQVELDKLPELSSRVSRLCELNVMNQVENISQTSVLIDAWQRKKDVTIHGLIYKLSDGLLKDLNVSTNKPF